MHGMELSAYLERINFKGEVRADLATLRALHRAHQHTVPFENINVQLRCPVVLEAAPNFHKIVRRRRGGWCYEANSVMEWALKEIGFDVVRLSAAVNRAQVADAPFGNHLCLLVRMGEPYLVDVGFGGSLAEPLVLRESQRWDRPYRIGLNETQDGCWRFSETAHGDPFSFDFRLAPADEALLSARCSFLQTDPRSPFVQNLVVQRRTADTHLSLRGRVLATTHAWGVERRLLSSGDELVETLRCSFDLDVPEAATLWSAISARHASLFNP